MVSKADLGYERQFFPVYMGGKWKREGNRRIDKIENQVYTQVMNIGKLIVLLVPIICLNFLQPTALGSSFSFTAVLDYSGRQWSLLLDDNGNFWPIPAEIVGTLEEGTVFKVTVQLEKDPLEQRKREQDIKKLLTTLIQ